MILRTFISHIPRIRYATATLVPPIQQSNRWQMSPNGVFLHDLKKQTFSTSQPFSEDDDMSKIENSVPSASVSSDVSAPGRLFALIYFAGKQRKVTVEDILVFPRFMECDVGDRIRLNKVMLVGSKDFTLIGRPILSLEQVKVETTVIEKTLSQTIISYWYKPRNRRRRNMYLQKNPLIYLRIDNVELLTDNLPDY